ncbi:MAG: transglutaminase domain-containing protein [Bacteroidia bacterium]
MKISVLFIFSVLITYSAYSQTASHGILLSNKDEVLIRDGDNTPIKWGVNPAIQLDVYTSSQIGEIVTFYSDIDSLSFLIHPDSVYNFVVLQEGADSAYSQVRYKPSYLDILKTGGTYKTGTDEKIAFTYQDSSHVALKELREKYNLDSIAGSGNEFARMINVLYWVHNLVPHDGQNENPAVKNAGDLISVCDKDDRGLNCRGLSTVLNECYLAMGFKSRILTCMPKDSVFRDCHVINVVYSNLAGKWLWLDPTNASYVMNSSGQMLGPADVRQLLIDDEQLILNPDANWNNKESTEIEYHLYYYMSKNLYRFKSPLRSEYNYETNGRGKLMEYVELLPVDGYNQTPKVTSVSSDFSGTTVKTYKTNSAKSFWAAPN